MNRETPSARSASTRADYLQIRQITLIGSVINALLALAKIVGGVLTGSQALVADGIHSLSDLATDILVIVAARQGSQAADREHPYGHGRIQTAASMLLALSLAFIAAGLAWDAVERLRHPGTLLHPGLSAMAIAILSILLKEVLCHYTMRVAQRLESGLLRANAWHHRSDALSSLIVVAGIAGVMGGFDWADAIATIVVTVMIAQVAYSIGRVALAELIDTAADPGLVDQIHRYIQTVPGVLDAHELRTRRMGSDVLADVHLRVDPHISVSEGHRIGDEVIGLLKAELPRLSDVIVHIDPEDDRQWNSSDTLPLRPELESAVNTILQLHGIAETGNDGGPTLVLHYLGGGLVAELTLALPLDGAIEEFRQLTTAIEAEIIDSTPVTTVNIKAYMGATLRHPAPN